MSWRARAEPSGWAPLAEPPDDLDDIIFESFVRPFEEHARLEAFPMLPRAQETPVHAQPRKRRLFQERAQASCVSRKTRKKRKKKVTVQVLHFPTFLRRLQRMASRAAAFHLTCIAISYAAVTCVHAACVQVEEEEEVTELR
eukprot:COSAG02_NODE_14707_length_1244_cov_18.143231_3_plen_141_part_01